MKNMMGMHKMGQGPDTNRFMNPTVTRTKNNSLRRRVGKGKGMRQDGAHGHMGMGKAFMKGFMGSMRMGMNGMALIPHALRRVGNVCRGLKGQELGRCRARVMGGCNGLTGQALMGCKSQRRKLRKRVLGGAWVLVKKSNGQCECVKNPGGQIVIGRFHSFKECDTHKAHDC